MHGDSPDKAKAVVRSSHCYRGDSCTGNTASLYWDALWCLQRFQILLIYSVSWYYYGQLLADARLMRMVIQRENCQIINKIKIFYKLLALVSLNVETKYSIIPRFHNRPSFLKWYVAHDNMNTHRLITDRKHINRMISPDLISPSPVSQLFSPGGEQPK